MGITRPCPDGGVIMLYTVLLETVQVHLPQVCVSQFTVFHCGIVKTNPRLITWIYLYMYIRSCNVAMGFFSARQNFELLLTNCFLVH